MTHRTARILSALLLAIGAASANAASPGGTDKKDQITDYLADIGATAVSAGDMIGVTGSAIANIQSAHDLTLAVNPLSSGSGQGGFGIAITPARTTLLPMSGVTYVQNPLMRFLGAVTFSYAANSSAIAGASYRKQALSVDASYYWNKSDDPVVRAAEAFGACKERKAKNMESAEYEALHPDMTPDDRREVEKIRQAAVAAWEKCLKSTESEAKWNATKLAISAGDGWIKPDSTAGASQSLGRSFLLGGVIQSGQNGATYLTARRIIGEIDLKTLAGTPTFSDSTLAGIRYTYGLESDSTLRLLAEVSNAKSNSTTATVSNTAFKYAVGFDKKLASSIWAEFRFGRGRTTDGATTQNTALLNLNWSPTSTLPLGGKE